MILSMLQLYSDWGYAKLVPIEKYTIKSMTISNLGILHEKQRSLSNT